MVLLIYKHYYKKPYILIKLLCFRGETKNMWKIKSKLAEVSGIMAALLIAVLGLALVGTVASFANTAKNDTNVSSNPGAVALIGLSVIIFVILIVYAMVKKVQG